MELTLIRFGNSVGLTIPRVLCEHLGFAAGQAVEVKETDGKLIIASKTRNKYHLADMLADCDSKAPLPADLAAWESIAPVGNEVLQP
jgi:antitoxin ChpS